MKLYKFRPLITKINYDRVIGILEDGFYCCKFFDFNDMNEGVFTVSPQTENINLEGKLNYRICSFSKEKALKSQLMWGHYANAGMGIAIEIDTEDSSNFQEVIYGKNGRFGSYEQILTNKSAEWSYEEEYRYLSENDNNFFKTKIYKIFIGTPYKSLGNYNEIKNKHTKLIKFLKNYKKLEKICQSKKIKLEEYYFN